MTAPLQPHRDGSTTLRDGRTLAWAMYGDPEGDTVFWFHGTPGARHQLPADSGELARQRGLRIVTIERPGTGDSSPHSYEHLVEFAADFAEVADEVGAEKFAVVGLSGGGPYTLAVAHELPERMTVGVVLGGIGPTRGVDSIVSHTMLLVPAAAVLEKVSSPINSGLRQLIHLLTPYADSAIDIFFNLLPGDRAHLMARPLDRRQFTADLIDANDRSGIAATTADLILFGRHWGFELRNIEVPIIFYGGSSDIIVPYLHAERQAKRVPGSRLRTYEGRGHFAGYTSPIDILNDLRDAWPASTNGKHKPAKKAAAKKPAAKKAAAK